MHVYTKCMDISLRITADTHKMLSALARLHKRTIKGEVEYLIEQEYIRYYVPDVGASPVGANVK